jgi:hypothetical protein
VESGKWKVESESSCHQSLSPEKFQPATFYLHPSTFNLQPSTCHLQPSTCHLQPATFNLQPATFNLQPATFHLPPSTCHREASLRYILGYPLPGISCTVFTTFGTSPIVTSRSRIMDAKASNNESYIENSCPSISHFELRISQLIDRETNMPDMAMPRLKSDMQIDVESDLFTGGINAIISEVTAIPRIASTILKRKAQSPACQANGHGAQ